MTFKTAAHNSCPSCIFGCFYQKEDSGPPFGTLETFLNKLLTVRKIKATFHMLVSMQYGTFYTENVGVVCKEETNKNKNCQDDASDFGGNFQNILTIF